MDLDFEKKLVTARRDTFKSLKLTNAEVLELYYLDSLGYLLYYLNKIFFKEEKYPTKLKIFFFMPAEEMFFV